MIKGNKKLKAAAEEYKKIAQEIGPFLRPRGVLADQDKYTPWVNTAKSLLVVSP